MMYYVYFAKSQKNGKVYVGTTSKDPHVRITEHNQGTNTWSRHNKPLDLLYFEAFICKFDALHREKFYKSGFGRKIRNAIISVL